MANLEKHKKNPVQEWMEAEESTLPSQARSSHVLGAYIKIPKAASKRTRRVVPPEPAPKPELALAREPAPPTKAEEKRSQTSSPEHLRKVSRISKLRAPYSYQAGRTSPGGARG